MLALLLGTWIAAPTAILPLRVASDEEAAAVLQPQPGPVRIIHLWASWCSPCLAELPELTGWLRELPPRSVDVVFWSMDAPEKAGDAAQLLHRVGGVPGMSWRADSAALVKLRTVDPAWTGELPMTIVLSAENKIVLSQHGISDLRALKDAVRPWLPARSRAARDVHGPTLRRK